MPDVPAPPSNPVNAATRSWRTTVLAIGGVLVACWPLVAQPLLDSDPATQPQWGLALGALLGALGLSQARDHAVSSEQAGAKP